MCEEEKEERRVKTHLRAVIRDVVHDNICWFGYICREGIDNLIAVHVMWIIRLMFIDIVVVIMIFVIRAYRLWAWLLWRSAIVCNAELGRV